MSITIKVLKEVKQEVEMSLPNPSYWRGRYRWLAIISEAKCIHMLQVDTDTYITVSDTARHFQYNPFEGFEPTTKEEFESALLAATSTLIQDVDDQEEMAIDVAKVNELCNQ